MKIKAFFERSIIYKIGAILAVFELLLVGSVLVVISMLKQLEADTLVVNVAGRQRMLSQRMTKNALIIARTQNDQARTALQNDKKLFERSLNGLLQGDMEMKLPAASSLMQAKVNGLISAYQPLKQAFDSVLTYPPHNTEFVSAMEAILENNEVVLKKADEVTAAFQNESEAKSRQLLWVLYGVGFIGLIIFVVSLFLIKRTLEPLKAVVDAAHGIAYDDLASMAQVAQAISEGDLRHQVVIKVQPISIDSKDEIGRLAEAFNQMIDSLWRVGKAFGDMNEKWKGMLQQIAHDVAQLNEASRNMSEAAGQSKEATQQISITIMEISKGILQQTEAVTRTSEAMQQLESAIEEVEMGARNQSETVLSSRPMMEELMQTSSDIQNGVNEQAQSLDHAVKVSQNVSSVIHETISYSEQVTEKSQESAQAAVQGARMASDISQGVMQVKNAAEALAQRIHDLSDNVSKINVVIDTIEDVANQTNLLALNAAIEAARAGTYGRGFAVVADEVRKLAERTSSATQEVGEMIRNIQIRSGEAVATMNRAAKEVQEVVDLTFQAKQQFEGIASTTQTSAETVQTIRTSLKLVLDAQNQLEQAIQQAMGVAERNRHVAEQMSINAVQLMEKSQQVGAISQENLNITQEMTNNAHQVSEMIEQVASVSEQTSAAAEEVSASASEVSGQANQVSQAAESLRFLAESLQQLFQGFKV